MDMIRWRRPVPFGWAIIVTIWFGCAAAASADTGTLPSQTVIRTWVQEMKSDPRGPFLRLRWFCNDGTVHPPNPYPCGDRGGGRQHGQWTERTTLLRNHGYLLANVLAAIDPEQLLADTDWPRMLGQMILEQFLITADDGWIFRRAQYYRGALQAEGEKRGGRLLLRALVNDDRRLQSYFLLVREAVRFLPHSPQTPVITEVHQISTNIAEMDPDFADIRTKIHNRPGKEDIQAVRIYAEGQTDPILSAAARRLTTALEKVYSAEDPDTVLMKAARTARNPDLSKQLADAADRWRRAGGAGERLRVISETMALIRERIVEFGAAGARVAALDASLSLESALWRMREEIAAAASASAGGRSRRQLLENAQRLAESLYGAGLISRRQWGAVSGAVDRLPLSMPLSDYIRELNYVSLVAGWADGQLRFYFQLSMDRFSELDPLAMRYYDDRLRAGPLLMFADLMDGLLQDAERIGGVRHTVFGQPAGAGVRALNAGLAKGRLRWIESDAAIPKLTRNDIAVLQASTAELPAVGGIITRGEGNAISHVQILARNLGVPNVTVSERLLEEMTSYRDKQVVLAVSPGGIVHLETFGPRWEGAFEKNSHPAETVRIPADTGRLDLDMAEFVSLGDLRATDSGRIAGPKAANLGELKSRYPDAVFPGLVIPFGVYARMLERPADPDDPGGPAMKQWIADGLKRLRGMPEGGLRQQAVSEYLRKVRNWFHTLDPGDRFRTVLSAALQKKFGNDGSYGVFVRSDTNVEDLPGFSGAGLNKTVPNVVGFDNILESIKQVWASPFTERSFSWRQERMEAPEELYVSVLLMKSVPAEKSGVMVTADPDTGDTGTVFTAANFGVGGAVSGQRAEQLRIPPDKKRIRLMSQATEPLKTVVLPDGGVGRVPVFPEDAVLHSDELDQLLAVAENAPRRFESLRTVDGTPLPADIEFGFEMGRLYLFQIRPYLNSNEARRNRMLAELDRRLSEQGRIPVNLEEIPGGAQ